MTKVKIAVQDIQTKDQEKKTKQMFTYNIIQKYERKKNKQKQTKKQNKLLLLLNTDTNTYKYMKKNNPFSKMMKLIFYLKFPG